MSPEVIGMECIVDSYRNENYFYNRYLQKTPRTWRKALWALWLRNDKTKKTIKHLRLVKIYKTKLP